MEIKLRKARKADLLKILEILNFEIENSTAVYDLEPKSISDIENWFQEKSKKGFPVWVAELDNSILGYGSYGQFRVHCGFKGTVEHSIYVAEFARKKGVGKLILGKLIEIARNNNLHTMIAGIDASNKGSYLFHEKLGFEEVGRIKESAYKFGQWLDLVFMQKML